MVFMQSEKTFPIMGQRPGTHLSPIPWDVIAPHDLQALHNHGGQSLTRLAERGGLSPCEALSVLENRPWAPMEWEESRRQLYALVEARLSPHCDGDQHLWPFDYKNGDACFCGGFYLQNNYHGRVCVTVAK